MNKHESINYIELPAKNMAATKTFFKAVFNWQFVDYGDEYMAFTDAALEGGFYLSNQSSSTDNGAALVVFYSEALEATLAKVQSAGGTVIQPVFAFPGGRRFHFADPSGNEFAVWSDIEQS